MRRKRNKSINWALMARYLNRETSAADDRAVHDWLSEDAHNQQLMSTTRDKWEKTQGMSEENYDVDLAWKKVSQKIQGAQATSPAQETISLPKRTAPSLSFILRVAAVIILMLGSSYLIISRFTFLSSLLTADMIVESDPASEKTFQLPDGSLIHLNASSRIIYSKREKEHVRQVRLSGEAFFNVSHDASNPFIVIAGNAIVKVTGTSFNIKAEEGKDQVSVFVESGTVELAGLGSDQYPLVIEAGFTGIVTGTKIERIVPSDPNLLSWKTKNLVFQETKISDVLEALNHTFHSNIICKQEKIGDFRFTGNFDNQPVDTILQVLSTAFNLRVDYRDATIELKLEE